MMIVLTIQVVQVLTRPGSKVISLINFRSEHKCWYTFLSIFFGKNNFVKAIILGENMLGQTIFSQKTTTNKVCLKSFLVKIIYWSKNALVEKYFLSQIFSCDEQLKK